MPPFARRDPSRHSLSPCRYVPASGSGVRREENKRSDK